jgi:dihydrofolate reductase
MFSAAPCREQTFLSDSPLRRWQWHDVGRLPRSIGHRSRRAATLTATWRCRSCPATDPLPTTGLLNFLNDATKVVFSRLRDGVTWRNSRLLRELDTEQIAAMKAEPGSGMLVFGSGSIVAQLTEHGLIDEYQLVVNPTLLGGGRPLSADLSRSVPLQLLEAKAYPTGNICCATSLNTRSSPRHDCGGREPLCAHLARRLECTRHRVRARSLQRGRHLHLTGRSATRTSTSSSSVSISALTRSSSTIATRAVRS